MKLHKLQQDLSTQDRYSSKISAVFENSNFYFIQDYPVKELLPLQPWDYRILPMELYPWYYYNIDYRMLSYYDKLHEFRILCDWMFFLVTSFDEKGIVSPINLFDYQDFHPGGKRVTVAHFMGIETVPVLLQTDNKISEKKISTIEELHNLYGNNCSFITRDNKRLEVLYHGETDMRDSRGYDDWYAKAESIKNEYFGLDSFSKYIYDSGLTVYNRWKDQTIDNNGFKITYTTSRPETQVFLEVLDEDILSKDLWKLYFYIDPSVYKKIDETGKIIIHNNFGRKSNKIMLNCKMSRTLLNHVNYYDKDHCLRRYAE